MKGKNNVFFLALIILGYSCSKNPKDFSDPLTYSDYFKNPDHDLRKEKSIGEYSFAVQYKTAEYALIQEQGISPGDSAWSELKNEFNGNLHFTFRITSLAGNDPMVNTSNYDGNYEQNLQYFSFAAQHDFFLINGQDTLSCKNYLFERTYGMSPNLTFIMAFDTISQVASDGLRFVYYDKAFGKGPIQFHYSQETLSNIPKLI